MSSYTSAAAVLSRSISKPSLFSVSLNSGVDQKTNDHLNFFCKVADIPSVKLQTVVTFGQENMGVGRETPSGIIFAKPYVITVIENSDFLVYKNIRQWIDRTGFNMNPGLSGNRNIRLNYYKNYTRDIDFRKLEWPDKNIARLIPEGNIHNKIFKQSLHIKFLHAYPIGIGPIQIASDMENNYVQYEVEFTYESYIVMDIANPNIPFPVLPPPGAFPVLPPPVVFTE